LGFNLQEEDYKRIEHGVLKALKDTFQPEFLNRLDNTIVFRPLNKELLLKIVDIHLNQFCARMMRDIGLTLDISEAAREFLAEKGYDPEYGARPVKRAITTYLQDPLAEALLQDKFRGNLTLRVLRKGDYLVFRK
jgi:ATP-dependent Clp protease ATP-binding subunit ClpC